MQKNRNEQIADADIFVINSLGDGACMIQRGGQHEFNLTGAMYLFISISCYYKQSRKELGWSHNYSSITFHPSGN